MTDEQMRKDIRQIRHALFGENGNPEDGLVYKFSVTDERQKTIRDKLERIEKFGWLIISGVAILILNALWELIQSPATQKVVEVIVTATPTIIP